MYKKLYHQCGYDQQALTSDKHFIGPNNPNYYQIRNFYEKADNISNEVALANPQELKFGRNSASAYRFEEGPFNESGCFPDARTSSYRFEDESEKLRSKLTKKCKTCALQEPFKKIPYNGNTSFKPGSKTVVNCTNCYSGEGQHAIPVTPVDTHDVRMVKDIYNDPQACNVKGGWGKSRYNLIEPYDSFDDLLKKKDGLKKTSWGPATWGVIHAMSFGYSNNPTMQEKVHAWNFFNALPLMLPCGECGKDCNKYIKTNPPNVENRKTLSEWAHKFHNMVNRRLGKPQYPWSAVKKRYEDTAAACTN